MRPRNTLCHNGFNNLLTCSFCFENLSNLAVICESNRAHEHMAVVMKTHLEPRIPPLQIALAVPQTDR